MPINKDINAILTEMQDKAIEFGNTFEIKAVGTDSANLEEITIEGFASTSSKDRSWDIIPGTAWADPEARANYLMNPIVLAFHDHKKPIGTCESLEVKDGGLFVRIKLVRSLNEKVFDAVRSGVLKSFSVGFRLLDLEYDQDTDAFILTKLELMEISVVSVPCNPEAVFQVIKSFKVSERNKMPAENNTPVVDQTLVAKAVQEELSRIQAQKDAEAAVLAEKEKEKAAIAAMVKEQTASLVEDIKKSLDTEGLASTIAKFQEQIQAQKPEVIAAQTTSKMQHPVNALANQGPVSDTEKSAAFLLSRILRKDVFGTSYGAALKEKAAGFDSLNAAVHIPGAHTVNSADWETTFVTTFWEDVRRELVVEPMFRSMTMTGAVVRLPKIPEQNYASYIAVDDLKTTDSTAPVNNGNRPTEIILTAHKLSAKDLIGNEETEDTILAILPIIRDNLVRRMARSSDRSLLRGAGATAADPIKGLVQYAIDAAKTSSLSIGAGDKVTALGLQQLRRKLGVYGIRPSDVVYIVSTEAYYDLLEDLDMRKFFDVGSADRATMLAGQVANVNGSRIVVSDEFGAKAVGNSCAIVVNMRNYVLGNLRTLTIKSEEKIESDANLIVATRRFGMAEMEAGGVAALGYVA